MRNNIAFKFIAIVLCAASLAGILGSTLGIVALTEKDLYNKTVEQVRQEDMNRKTQRFATSLAQMYASTALGGVPEDLANQVLSSYGLDADYGYTITDAEGNIVSAYNDLMQHTGTTYTYQPTGQYMYLVDLETESEKYPESYPYATEHPAQASGIRIAQALEASYGYDIPSGGMDIVTAIFYDQNGGVLFESWLEDGDAHCNWTLNGSASSYTFTDYSYTGPIGTVADNNGMVIFQSVLDAADEPYPGAQVYGIYLAGRHGETYELYSDTALGRLEAMDAYFYFISELEAPSQIAATALEEAPSGWVVETIPGEENKLTLIAPDGTATEIPVPGAVAFAEETLSTEPTLPAETIVSQTIPEETQGFEETIPETAPVEDPLILPAMPEETKETIPPATTEATTETQAPTETAPAEEAQSETEPTSSTEAAEETQPEPTEETVPETTVPETTAPEETQPPTEETFPQETEPMLINGRRLGEYQVNEHWYWDSSIQESVIASFVYVPMPELTVTLFVDESTLVSNTGYRLLDVLRTFRSFLLPVIGIGLLVFAVFALYLCTAAGRKPKSEEVRAGGLNRVPLDLHFLVSAFAIALAASYGPRAAELLLERDFTTACAFGALVGFFGCLLFVVFCFSFVAQLKTPGGFWYRNTLFGHFIRLTFRFCDWLTQFCLNKGFPLFGKACKSAWHLTVSLARWTMQTTENTLRWLGKLLDRIGRWLGHRIHRFLSLLPLTWQWLVTGFFCLLISFLIQSHNTFLILVGILVPLAVLLYASRCFGLLAESSQRMSKGDLDTKVDDKHMVGCFKEFASDLNDLAGVAVVAAQKQLKSERMKTELITNVSHDIKTPLTSLINYVDLLQKPHTPEEEAQYLEVLDRQSQRLKKLIDDLMDMSKANTGNMQVDINQVDAVEAVTQALGEFADKLDRARLIPVFRHEDANVPMMADGRLVWRVLSNLLGNAVKYAMPGTRLYIDLMTLEGKVVISLKNISREELNVDAEELMERFVRGDDSRNTEGSGLGLNIAKSLMELQKCQLQLLVDGDLFKVTLIFPGA